MEPREESLRQTSSSSPRSRSQNESASLSSSSPTASRDGARRAPAHHLDASWTTIVDRLRAEELGGLRLVVGGRSLGARVACRTAAATGAIAVLCLAFPLVPPRRSAPVQSRLPELDAVTVPTLVVQGSRDRFGIPPASRTRTVVEVPGDHSLRTDPEAVAAAVRDWLPRVVTS